jgi:hypothetical protein
VALVNQLAGKIIERIDQTDRLTDLHASRVCSSEAKITANLKNDLNIITGTQDVTAKVQTAAQVVMETMAGH